MADTAQTVKFLADENGTEIVDSRAAREQGAIDGLLVGKRQTFDE